MQTQETQKTVTPQDWLLTGFNDGCHGNPRLTIGELFGASKEYLAGYKEGRAELLKFKRTK